MSNKRSLPTDHRKLGLGVFLVGLLLICISFAIQLVFIKGTNFKQEYRKRQYQQCLEVKTTDVCNDKYPETSR